MKVLLIYINVLLLLIGCNIFKNDVCINEKDSEKLYYYLDSSSNGQKELV